MQQPFVCTIISFIALNTAKGFVAGERRRNKENALWVVFFTLSSKSELLFAVRWMVFSLQTSISQLLLD